MEKSCSLGGLKSGQYGCEGGRHKGSSVLRHDPPSGSAGRHTHIRIVCDLWVSVFGHTPVMSREFIQMC